MCVNFDKPFVPPQNPVTPITKPSTEGLSKEEIKDTENIKNGNVKIKDTDTTNKVKVIEVPKDVKLPDDFGKATQQDPTKIVESIRSGTEPKRNELLLNFQSKLDNMDSSSLRQMRDYIGNEMASPQNNDDPLLGALLVSVNKELDSRKPRSPIFSAIPISSPVPGSGAAIINHSDISDIKPTDKETFKKYLSLIMDVPESAKHAPISWIKLDDK